MTNRLPEGLLPGGTSPVFTEDTLPAARQAKHTLAPGHWAALNVLEGSLRFVNLDTGEERLISAPDLVTIHPGLPLRVAIEGRVRCRIDFYSWSLLNNAARCFGSVARCGENVDASSVLDGAGGQKCARRAARLRTRETTDNPAAESKASP